MGNFLKNASERTVVSSYLVLVRDKTERGKSQLKVEYIVRENKKKGEKSRDNRARLPVNTTHLLVRPRP